ncbi:MAG: D-alanine--D-alanine ligase [Candidatus Taylorbacteria bacterium]|nr:D-alanine--D-alanine ligase [Candidatus Taylorbacteria bacterium]
MPKKKRKFIPFLGPMLQRLAPKIGAKVIMEPEWGVVGQILFKNGNIKYFRDGRMDLNTLGSTEIAVDKDYSTFFMKNLGYNTILGKSFYSPRWHKAIGAKHRTIDDGFTYAEQLEFPVIIKPNSGTQGSHVSLVHNKKEFYKGMKAIFKYDRIALVQSLVVGTDYRIVVLDKKVISAYKRIPLSITGDGKSTIIQLLKAKQKEFIIKGRDTKIKTKDPRIADKLLHQGFTMHSILKQEEKIFLLDNANLSTGGDSVDVTDTMHESVKKLAVKLTKDMGLRLCGVDIMIDGNIEDKLNNYWIIEINAAPGLDHYVTSGAKQEKIVEKLYLEVLKNMGK